MLTVKISYESALSLFVVYFYDDEKVIHAAQYHALSHSEVIDMGQDVYDWEHWVLTNE
jgi:hypothetical protein